MMPKTDRTLHVDYRPLAALIPYARNARTHSEEQVAQIAASIREFGFTNPILTDGDNGIIAGHGRLLAARKLGMTTVPVIELAGMSEAQKRAYILADNKLAENAGWDRELLGLELGDLASLGFDLSLTGFGEDEIARLAHLGGPGLTDPDAVPEVEEQAVSQPGDVWVLGKHRLVCGDSTSHTDVGACLAGVKPHLMVTDPPFGVNYDPAWRERLGIDVGTLATGKVLNDDRADWREAWALFPGDVAYVWHAALQSRAVLESLEAAGFVVRAQIIWDKTRLVIGRGDYHWQHEPCQPAGTMVQKVVERGAGSQPAKIEHVPIESLRAGDFVVSYNPYESVVRRRGREITRVAERQFDGLMHTIAAAGRVTRATPEHRFSVRLNPDAAGKQVVYLMRRDWWRVGRVSLFNTRGFGLSTRLADNKAEQAWIISVHGGVCEAQCAEQALSCRYGIPTPHWEVSRWEKAPERVRSSDMIASIYTSLDLGALAARATLLLREHRLDPDHPLITGGEGLMFSRKATRLVRACNVFAQIMQIPMPAAEGDEFSWVTVAGNDATPFDGPVYSINVDKDLHYVADGLVTHNCVLFGPQGKDRPLGGWPEPDHRLADPAPPQTDSGHGTEKPVECMKRPIENNSSPRQAVYEPFCGSGTTIIAAEMTGRSCHAIELNPAYVDVAIRAAGVH